MLALTQDLRLIDDQALSNCRAPFLPRSTFLGGGCVVLLVVGSTSVFSFLTRTRTEKVDLPVLKT